MSKKNGASRGNMCSTARWALMIGLAAAIFVGDTLSDREIAVAVFYVIVVLIGAECLSSRGVFLISAGCLILTFTSFALSRSGAYQSGVINCILSVSAIAATTYLALKSSSLRLAEQEARAQLIRLAHVNSLGETTASIAHEVNQPLTGIVTGGSACLNWLASDPPNLPKAKQAVERMILDANRASGIIVRIRDLYKRGETKAKWLEATTVVDGALALCREDLERHGVVLMTKYGSPAPEVLVDAIQIELVFFNIISNAIDSMVQSSSSRREIAVEMSLSDNLAQFVIKDTGRGLSPGKLEEIFEAFYSTKPDGTGVGLAISRSIVEAHGGKIWACTNRGEGAEFRFTLPGRQRRAS